ncbi:glycosyltransferase family 1 protein [Pandoraea sp. SD6-2]|uniref:glycosyltransferase family 4 protein n=1 Tax=Pandoraea sp. SD6-2 TaxID=1286093 RepID=UPI000330A699|nr:glycosyltransferase family 1 protein [Pandoraea sp. SD6-2]EON11207.1 group 1 glycosyl transferase [Pandoraea sp. SD6-2]
MGHRLLFDVTELTRFDKGTGIQRVTRALLQALRQAPPLGWYVVAVRGDARVGRYFAVTSFDQPLCEVNLNSSSDVAIEPAAGDIFLSVDLAYNMTRSLRDELSRFRSCGVGIYFVIHDLIPLMHPEWFEGTNAWFEGNDYLKLFRYWFECVGEESDGLLCISAEVRNDVEAWLATHPPKRRIPPRLDYFHLGSDIAESRPSSGLPCDAVDVLSRIKSSTTFLMVGTLEPRKGHEIALDAMEGFWAQGEDVRLVFVGRQGWRMEHLIERIRSHPRLGTQLFWLDGISDEYLCQVYMASSAMLALSLAEGFGLPLVEAAHYRLPLIVRDIPVFREVCGEAATYFQESSAGELQGLLRRWLTDRDTGRCTYPDQMRVLSWRDSARQLMSALGRMHGDEFFWIGEQR